MKSPLHPRLYAGPTAHCRIFARPTVFAAYVPTVGPTTGETIFAELAKNHISSGLNKNRD